MPESPVERKLGRRLEVWRYKSARLGAKRRVVFCDPKGDKAAVPARLLPGMSIATFPFKEKAGLSPVC